MKKPLQDDFKKRLFFLAIFFAFFALLLVIRLIDIQLLHYNFYHERSVSQRTRIIKLAANRGDILDRNGQVLATSIDVVSIYLAPHEIIDAAKTASHLSRVLNLNENEVRAKLANKKKKFVWLLRKIPLSFGEKVKELKLKGVGVQKEKKRVYPQGGLAAQVVGFCGVDNQGLCGLELSMDDYLRGKEGKIITESDPQGRELYFGEVFMHEPGEEGMDLTLTIDANIQHQAEKILAGQIKKFSAASGILMVVDSLTGEILALAGLPAFDPNQYAKAPKKNWRSKAVDVYEPGSTFKVITVASCLNEGLIDDKTRLKALDTFKVGDREIKNSHQIKWSGPTITVSKMLEQSINTGAAQLALMLGPERFYKNIASFGFGQKVEIELPGESRGIVRHWRDWYPSDVGRISFGQGVAVTPLQMISAFSAFCNKGKMVRPFLVKKIEDPGGRFYKEFTVSERGVAVSEKAADEIVKLMENVVVFGSGRLSRLEQFKVAGKTGTAQKALPSGRGYMKNSYIASFIGFVPASSPRLLGLIIIDDPRGSIWGEVVAGPAFKEIMEFSLRYLNVPPDVI